MIVAASEAAIFFYLSQHSRYLQDPEGSNPSDIPFQMRLSSRHTDDHDHREPSPDDGTSVISSVTFKMGGG